MRKLLLAGVALAGVAVYLPSAAFAQSAVFPETTRAGKLDGAAPGSVSVSIGGTMFVSAEFQSGTGNSGNTKPTAPELQNYLRLYPNFDYANPAGVHFGVSGEIRSAGSTQATKGQSSNTLYWQSAFAYVSSDKFGKIEFGSPNDAVDALGVGTGDNYGTGGFFGEYGWTGAPNFIAADSYDGYDPHQKITYLSPTLAGFSVGLSYQPNTTSLTNGGLTDAGDFGHSHNRYSGAVAFSHSFGAASLSADVAYTGASAGSMAPVGKGGFQDVSIFDAGASVKFAGVEVEGSINTGKYAYAGTGNEPVLGPEGKGQKSTTAYIVGPGYTFGPFAIGAQYYGVTFDAAQTGGTLGGAGKVSGEAVGGSYAVGPGVNVNFDFATDSVKTPGGANVHGNLYAAGAYFAW